MTLLNVLVGFSCRRYGGVMVLMIIVMMMIELNACLGEGGRMRNPSCLDRTCLVDVSQHSEVEASPKVY